MSTPPDPAERGRYVLYPHPSGRGMLIGRATGLCDRCSSCGCGDQQELIDLSPAGIAATIKKMGGLGKLRSAITL